MLRDFVLELISAPGAGTTITLPGVAPAGRLTWAAGFVTSQAQVFYVIDDSLQQEWGIGVLTIGAPSTIARPAVVLGNSAGTTARLNFIDTCRCYSALPSAQTVWRSYCDANVGRNLIHNSRFNVNQRGNGPWTTNSAYSADRWLQGLTTSTISTTIIALSDADRIAIGDESADSALQCVVGGTAGAADCAYLAHRVEAAQRLGGKTVSMSFWAKASSGTPKIGFSCSQNFGTGGSPSSTVIGIGSTATAALSTAWTRYTIPAIAIPTTIGKVFGTSGNDLTQLILWFSSGATNNANAGGIGVQSGTVQIWGVQLEFGSVVSSLEPRDFGADLKDCTRFFQTGTFQLAYYAPIAGIGFNYRAPMQDMRSVATVAVNATTSTNITSNAIDTTTNSIRYYGVSVASGTVNWTGTYTLSSDL